MRRDGEQIAIPFICLGSQLHVVEVDSCFRLYAKPRLFQVFSDKINATLLMKTYPPPLIRDTMPKIMTKNAKDSYNCFYLYCAPITYAPKLLFWQITKDVKNNKTNPIFTLPKRNKLFRRGKGPKTIDR
jgi:hypothetical protein